MNFVRISPEILMMLAWFHQPAANSKIERSTKTAFIKELRASVDHAKCSIFFQKARVLGLSIPLRMLTFQKKKLSYLQKQSKKFKSKEFRRLFLTT